MKYSTCYPPAKGKEDDARMKAPRRRVGEKPNDAIEATNDLFN